MSFALRSFVVLTFSCCLLPSATSALQLRQPVSVLPLAGEKASPQALPRPIPKALPYAYALALPKKSHKAPQKRVIVAPQVDVVPQWLLQASKLPVKKLAPTEKVAQKTFRPSTLPRVENSPLPRVEAEGLSVLGDIKTSEPKIKTSESKSDGAGPTKENHPKLTPSEQTLEGPELHIPGVKRAQSIEGPELQIPSVRPAQRTEGPELLFPSVRPAQNLESSK